MADPNDPTAGGTRPPPLRGEPHKVPWFWRMFGLYGRAEHPFNYDLDNAQDDKYAQSLSDWWAKQFQMSATRLERYRIFDEMDTTGVVPAILDLYSEETTQKDSEKAKRVP